MRAPIRSESDAFRLTVGAALAVGVAVVLGLLVSPAAGIVLLAALALAAAVAYVLEARGDRPPVLREAAEAPHLHAGRPGARHVLVVAHEALSGPELCERITGAGDAVEVDVLAPVLTSHIHLAVTDIDREIAEARDRLARSLRWAHEQGFAARGAVGDPSPISALEDELRDFGADEVIVVTRPGDRQTWQERGELERLRRELDIPVRHVTVA